VAMAEEKEYVEPEEHIKALAKIWKPKPKVAEQGATSRKEKKPR